MPRPVSDHFAILLNDKVMQIQSLLNLKMWLKQPGFVGMVRGANSKHRDNQINTLSETKDAARCSKNLEQRDIWLSVG